MKHVSLFCIAALVIIAGCNPPAEKTLRAQIIIKDHCAYFAQDSVDLCFDLFDKTGKKKFDFSLCSHQKRQDTMNVSITTKTEEGDQWQFVTGFQYCWTMCQDSMLCGRKKYVVPRVSVDSLMQVEIHCDCNH